MKLKNRIMSWILAPGAYLVWHALGNLEEWRAIAHSGDVFTLVHQPTDVQLWVARGGFFLDCEGELAGSIGPFDRHVLWWTRARGVRRHFYKEHYDRKAKLFLRMTQLTGKQSGQVAE